MTATASPTSPRLSGIRPKLAKATPIVLLAAIIAAGTVGVSVEVNAQEQRAAAVAELEQAQAAVAENKAASEATQAAVDAKNAELAALKEQLASTEGFIE
jgi:uncharacterized protein HemX